MSKINYAGAIHDLLLELFQIDDNYTIGEKLYTLENRLRTKRLYHSTDEEIHATLVDIIRTRDYFQDEPITED